MFRRLTTLFGLLFVCSTGQAQILEVVIWEALPGVPNAGPQLFANAMKVKAIHEKHGAEVLVAQDQNGMLHYAVTLDNYAARNKFYAGLSEDEANAAFWRDANANPVASRDTTYLLDVISESEGGPIYEVFIWQPMPGGVDVMVEGGMGAKPIHEKAGANVMIAMDRLNRMHYVLQFQNWDQHAKFWDTPNPEFMEYMQERSKNPTSELVKHYRGMEMQ